MLTDLARLGVVGMLLMLAMMALIFRHPLGILAPVLVVVQAVLWTLGTMAVLDVPMTMITNILPVFVICVGIGDSVHIQSVYRDAMQRGMEPHAAIVHAIGTTGIPVLFTTLTTAMGLLSFQFAAVDAIQDLGTFAALGVLLALVNSLVFLPAVLSLLPVLLRPQPPPLQYQVAGGFRLSAVLGGLVRVPFRFQGQVTPQEGLDLFRLYRH